MEDDRWFIIVGDSIINVDECCRNCDDTAILILLMLLVQSVGWSVWFVFDWFVFLKMVSCRSTLRKSCINISCRAFQKNGINEMIVYKKSTYTCDFFLCLMMMIRLYCDVCCGFNPIHDGRTNQSINPMVSLKDWMNDCDLSVRWTAAIRVLAYLGWTVRLNKPLSYSQINRRIK